MKKQEFKKLLKVASPSKLISNHLESKIMLTNKQLDEVIRKNEQDHNGSIIGISSRGKRLLIYKQRINRAIDYIKKTSGDLELIKILEGRSE